MSLRDRLSAPVEALPPERMAAVEDRVIAALRASPQGRVRARPAGRASWRSSSSP